MPGVVPEVHFIPANLRNFTQVARIVVEPENDNMLESAVEKCLARVS